MVTARALYNAARKPPSTPQEWQAFIILVASEAEGADQVDAKRAVAKLRQKVSKPQSSSQQSPGPRPARGFNPY